MSKRFYDIAKKNYPELWNRAMIDNLYNLGRLTDEEYADVIGEETENDTEEKS